MASIGNVIKLKDGTIGKIVMVLKGNYQIIANTGKIRWVSQDQIEEVLNVR